MIQILGLRKIKGSDGNENTVMGLLYKNWRVSSVAKLFIHIETVLQNIPESEQYNLHYTLASCKEGPGRKLISQDIIPIDIDDIDTERAEEYFHLACEVWGVDPNKTGCIMSGHGIQMVIQTREAFTDPKFFDQHRDEYKAYCERLNTELKLKNLPGKTDDIVWAETRTFRVPETINQKEGLPPVKAKLIQRNVQPQTFVWQTRPKLTPNAEPEELKRYPKPDDEAVIKGCEFLKSIANTKEKVEEPLWYAALSVVGRLENKELPHTLFSKNSENWDRERTNQKVEQAITRSGPLTCVKINQLWGKCYRCPHWGTGLPSPILIKNPKSITTEDMGFRKIVVDGKGNAKPGPVVYEDLRLAFERDHRYVVTADTEEVFVWKNTHWVLLQVPYIKNFAEEKITKPVYNKDVNEFVGLVRRTNVKTREFFTSDTANKLNLKNGVFNTKSGELEPHSPLYGFRYILNYEYDPKATAPMFDKFLNEVCLNDQSIKKLLLEYMGFTIANHNCDPPMALFLYGEGSNGKSTFIEVMRAVIGRDNCAAITLKDLQNEHMRDMLDGKLVNFSEETPKFSMVDNSVFKNLTDGGDVTARKLYHAPYILKNRAKFVFACNELPKVFDPTMGMFRRLLVVPFNATFEGDKIDRGLKHKLIERELPGILNMCLEHYAEFCKRGNFTQSRSVTDAVNEYRGQVDTARTWIEDNLFDIFEKEWRWEMRPGRVKPEKVGFKTFPDLFEIYAASMDSVREKPMQYVHFCKTLRMWFRRDTDRIRRIQTGQGKVFAVLGLKKPHPPAELH